MGFIAKSLVVLPRVTVRRRLSRIRILAKKLDEFPRTPHRQRLEHEGIGQAKDGGVGANAGTQGGDRHGREARGPPHRSQGVTNVVHATNTNVLVQVVKSATAIYSATAI